MRQYCRYAIVLVVIVPLLMSGCGASEPTPTPEPAAKVGVVLDTGGVDDKSFNEGTIRGAEAAAAEASLGFEILPTQSREDYEKNIESAVAEGADLVITVGFPLGEATARAARRHPEVRFAIVDNAYFPGLGCPDTVADCYTEEGGLTNVTSLMFAEDEAAYLAGVLAACMSESGTVASVAGMEIPPVVRFITGFQSGARSIDPDIVTLNQYIPDFADADTGELVGQGFVSEGADVIFGCGGATGGGGLLAAMDAGVMAIGVDVDQYLTYPEVQSALITSVMKNVDVAAAEAVQAFAEGSLEAGIQTATLANEGVGLAPYHDWEDRIPQECRELVQAAQEALIADPSITGAK